MTDDKIQREELFAIFGPTIPLTAVAHLQTADGSTSISDFRHQLTGMGILWKDIQQEQNVVEPDNMFLVFSADGTLVKRMRDGKPLFVAQSNEQAAQFVMLLNMGHVAYAKQWQEQRMASSGNYTGA